MEQYPTLVKIEKALKVNKAWCTIGLFFLTNMAVFFNIGAGFLTCLLGVGLPAYLSLISVNTPDLKDDQQWYADQFSHSRPHGSAEQDD